MIISIDDDRVLLLTSQMSLVELKAFGALLLLLFVHDHIPMGVN